MPEEKKAVFIDGESLLFMRHALGLKSIRFRGLGTLLRSIGRCQHLAEPPLCTINSDRRNNERCRWEIIRAGFHLELVTNVCEADDLFLRREILRCRYRPDIGEIILVSCDGEIIDALDSLRTVAPHVRRVFVAGTLLPDPLDGRCKIRKDLVRMFRNGLMNFVELNNYAEQIGVRT